jgi:hypothetical protein
MVKKIISLYLREELLEKIGKEKSNYSRNSFIENILNEKFKIE